MTERLDLNARGAQLGQLGHRQLTGARHALDPELARGKVHGGGALRARLGGQMQLGIGQRGSNTSNEAHIRDD